MSHEYLSELPPSIYKESLWSIKVVELAKDDQWLKVDLETLIEWNNGNSFKPYPNTRIKNAKIDMRGRKIDGKQFYFFKKDK